jgi:peptide/nickel transport system substrate-binding protein
MTHARIVTALLAIALVSTTGCDRKQKAAKDHAAPTDSASAPRRGGHAVLPSTEPRFLNPVLETRFNRAVPLIFEGLVGMNGSLEPVPVLAESWDVAPDGKRITFKLRKGVTWSDGQPFTSKDVAFTVEAIQTTDAPTSWKAYFANLDKLETPDDLTVVASYKRPYAPALTTWTVGIMPAHVYGGGALGDSPGNSEPVGTGPYKMVRWEKGLRVVLEQNPRWWNGHPNLDSIELRFDIPDQLAALGKGELDFADVPDVGAWASQTQLPEFRESYEVATVAGSLFRMIAWNAQRKPFDDRRVRIALTEALDRPRIIEDVLLGEARPLSAPFFPTMYGADPAIAPYPFDLGAAAKMLDEAGHAQTATGRFGLTIIAIVSQKTAANEEMFAIFRRDLAAIGIDMKVDYVSASEFENRIVLREFDAAFFGWLPDIPDPDPAALLHSSQIRVGQNIAGYADPDVDHLLEEAGSTPNRDERKALYRKLHAKLYADQPYTVVYAPYNHYAWSRRLHGVNPDDISSTPRFPGVARWWASTNASPGQAKAIER